MKKKRFIGKMVMGRKAFNKMQKFKKKMKLGLYRGTGLVRIWNLGVKVIDIFDMLYE